MLGKWNLIAPEGRGGLEPGGAPDGKSAGDESDPRLEYSGGREGCGVVRADADPTRREETPVPGANASVLRSRRRLEQMSQSTPVYSFAVILDDHYDLSVLAHSRY